MKFKMFIIFFIPVLLIGQKPPGYLGKRVALGYHSNIIPTFASPGGEKIKYSDGKMKRKLGIDFSHALDLELTASSRTTFVTSLTYGKYFFNPISYSDEVKNPSNNSTYVIVPGYASYKTLELMLGFRFYKEQLAPLGRYFGIMTGLGRHTSDEYRYLGYSGANGFGEIVIAEESIISYNLRMEFGDKKIFSDRWYFAYSLTLGMDLSMEGLSNMDIGLLPDASSIFNDSYYPEYFQYQNTQFLEKMGTAVLFKSIYSFKVSVGVLL